MLHCYTCIHFTSLPSPILMNISERNRGEGVREKVEGEQVEERRRGRVKTRRGRREEIFKQSK